MNFLRKKAPAAEQTPDTTVAPAASLAAPEPKAESGAPETPGIEDRIAALETQITDQAARIAELENRVTELEAGEPDESGSEDANAKGATVAPKAETPAPLEPAAEAPKIVEPAAEAAPKTRAEFLTAYNALVCPQAAGRYYDAHSAILNARD